jgi:proteasome-associated ATPase
MASPEPNRARDLVERALEQAPKDNPRLVNYLTALRDQLDKDAEQQAEQNRLLAEYEEAYQKLTQPANRICQFLGWLGDDLALIASGDQDYVVNLDPSVERSELALGVRVRVNEAYAIVGIVPGSGHGGLSQVAENLEDGRLRLGSDTPGAEARLVFRSAALGDAPIKAGDEVRVEGRYAVEHYPKQEARDYFLEDVPQLPWDKVGGQQEAIKLIRDTIELPLLHPELFERFEQKPVKGILLYGPPGNGKTLIGKATAYNLTQEYRARTGQDVKEYFMAISGPKILNMWLGETERMVREIFKTAREKAKEGRLVFIFMDEAESVLRTRSSGRYLNISNTVVPQFCAELDGMQALENVILMLTSNRPDYIDPAVLRPGRIDRKVKVVRPDRASSLQILGIYLHAGIPLDPAVLAQYDGEVECARRDLLEGAIAEIWATKKENEFLRVMLRNGGTQILYFKDLVSGAVLKSVVDRAKDLAIQRAIADGTPDAGVSRDDLVAAIRTEYRENEIFPKSDVLEDWLQLLDFPPENVAAVKPIAEDRGARRGQKSVM